MKPSYIDSSSLIHKDFILLGLCGFNLLVRFRSVLIAKTAISVFFSLVFYSSVFLVRFLINKCFGCSGVFINNISK